jgi:chromosome segregation ATPase
MWLAIAGGVGIVIGIVALIIAISAKNATNNDAKVTAAVNRAARLAVVGLHNQLQHDVASATTVLRQLQASGAAAAKTRQDLLRDINRNKTALAISAGTITKLQTSVNTVTAEVRKLQTTVTNLGNAQQELTKRVNALSSQTTTTTTTTP